MADASTTVFVAVAAVGVGVIALTVITILVGISWYINTSWGEYIHAHKGTRAPITAAPYQPIVLGYASGIVGAWAGLLSWLSALGDLASEAFTHVWSNLRFYIAALLIAVVAILATNYNEDLNSAADIIYTYLISPVFYELIDPVLGTLSLGYSAAVCPYNGVVRATKYFSTGYLKALLECAFSSLGPLAIEVSKTITALFTSFGTFLLDDCIFTGCDWELQPTFRFLGSTIEGLTGPVNCTCECISPLFESFLPAFNNSHFADGFSNLTNVPLQFWIQTPLVAIAGRQRPQFQPVFEHAINASSSLVGFWIDDLIEAVFRDFLDIIGVEDFDVADIPPIGPIFAGPINASLSLANYTVNAVVNADKVFEDPNGGALFFDPKPIQDDLRDSVGAIANIIGLVDRNISCAFDNGYKTLDSTLYALIRTFVGAVYELIFDSENFVRWLQNEAFEEWWREPFLRARAGAECAANFVAYVYPLEFSEVHQCLPLLKRNMDDPSLIFPEQEFNAGLNLNAGGAIAYNVLLVLIDLVDWLLQTLLFFNCIIDPAEQCGSSWGPFICSFESQWVAAEALVLQDLRSLAMSVGCAFMELAQVSDAASQSNDQFGNPVIPRFRCPANSSALLNNQTSLMSRIPITNKTVETMVCTGDFVADGLVIVVDFFTQVIFYFQQLYVFIIAFLAPDANIEVGFCDSTALGQFPEGLDFAATGLINNVNLATLDIGCILGSFIPTGDSPALLTIKTWVPCIVAGVLRFVVVLPLQVFNVIIVTLEETLATIKDGGFSNGSAKESTAATGLIVILDDIVFTITDLMFTLGSALNDVLDGAGDFFLVVSNVLFDVVRILDKIAVNIVQDVAKIVGAIFQLSEGFAGTGTSSGGDSTSGLEAASQQIISALIDLFVDFADISLDLILSIPQTVAEVFFGGSGSSTKSGIGSFIVTFVTCIADIVCILVEGVIKTIIDTLHTVCRIATFGAGKCDIGGNFTSSQCPKVTQACSPIPKVSDVQPAVVPQTPSLVCTVDVSVSGCSNITECGRAGASGDFPSLKTEEACSCITTKDGPCEQTPVTCDFEWTGDQDCAACEQLLRDAGCFDGVDTPNPPAPQARRRLLSTNNNNLKSKAGIPVKGSARRNARETSWGSQDPYHGFTQIVDEAAAKLTGALPIDGFVESLRSYYESMPTISVPLDKSQRMRESMQRCHVLLESVQGRNVNFVEDLPPSFVTDFMHCFVTLRNESFPAFVDRLVEDMHSSSWDGYSRCDVLVRQYNGDGRPWLEMSALERYDYRQCMYLRLASVAVRSQLLDEFPLDFFYNPWRLPLMVGQGGLGVFTLAYRRAELHDRSQGDVALVNAGVSDPLVRRWLTWLRFGAPHDVDVFIESRLPSIIERYRAKAEALRATPGAEEKHAVGLSFRNLVLNAMEGGLELYRAAKRAYTGALGKDFSRTGRGLDLVLGALRNGTANMAASIGLDADRLVGRLPTARKAWDGVLGRDENGKLRRDRKRDRVTFKPPKPSQGVQKKREFVVAEPGPGDGDYDSGAFIGGRRLLQNGGNGGGNNGSIVDQCITFEGGQLNFRCTIVEDFLNITRDQISLCGEYYSNQFRTYVLNYQQIVGQINGGDPDTLQEHTINETLSQANGPLDPSQEELVPGSNMLRAANLIPTVSITEDWPQYDQVRRGSRPPDEKAPRSKTQEQLATAGEGDFNFNTAVLVLLDDVLGFNVSVRIDATMDYLANPTAFDITQSDQPRPDGAGFFYDFEQFFYCDYQNSLGCTHGETLPFGEGLVATIAFIALVVFLFGYACSTFSFLIPVLLMFTLQVFLFVTYRASPFCFPALPMCLGNDIFVFLVNLVPRCLPWPEELLVNPSQLDFPTCASTPSMPEPPRKEFISCSEPQVGGFVDGLDNFAFLLRWSFPDLFFDIASGSNALFSLLLSIPVVGETFAFYAEALPPGAEIPFVFEFCFWETVLNLAAFALITLGLLVVAGALLAIGLVFLFYLGLILWYTAFFILYAWIHQELVFVQPPNLNSYSVPLHRMRDQRNITPDVVAEKFLPFRGFQPTPAAGGGGGGSVVSASSMRPSGHWRGTVGGVRWNRRRGRDPSKRSDESERFHERDDTGSGSESPRTSSRSSRMIKRRK